MKTLEDIQRFRDALDQKLRAAGAAATARGGAISVTEAERARFEEACQPRPMRHAVPPQPAKWVRC